MSDLMEMGERGEKGDAGQDGRRGESGVDGRRGESGDTGATGAAGRVLNLSQQLMLLVFVLLVFMLLAWRSEVNADKIEANTLSIAASQYESCLGNVEVLKRFNVQQDKLATVEQRSIDLGEMKSVASRELQQERIQIYIEARTLPLPICVKP